MPDPANPAQIKRVGRVQDVADDSSEMPHILINQARLHELFLEVMKNAPSRSKMKVLDSHVKHLPWGSNHVKHDQKVKGLALCRLSKAPIKYTFQL